MNFLSNFNIVPDVEIEFLCTKQDWDVIPKPFPAGKFMPEWFKKLPPKVDKRNILENNTIKRCPPFIDAMTTGWIIPLCADVQIQTNEDASNIQTNWKFYKNVVETHSTKQIEGHPHQRFPPMKFLNYWKIKVPKGYSVLFVPPINRPNELFECIAGYVDCDLYHEYINFPFFFKKPNYEGVLLAGTPLVQAIPIKRDSCIKDSTCRVFTDKEWEEVELTRRKRSSHESYYRDNLWIRNKP